MTAPKHPAPYSKVFKPLLRRLIKDFEPCLDPLAGIGSLGLPGLVHSELEIGWAAQCPRPTVAANAMALPFRGGAFRGVVTSPVYGNRMSDHYKAADLCSWCQGSGKRPDPVGPNRHDQRCRKCLGTGKSPRKTYREYLGQDLHGDNAGRKQWGKPYQDTHLAIWPEVVRVLADGGRFVLNVSDHYREGVLVAVSDWHRDVICGLGLSLVDGYTVPTRRHRRGQNHQLRADHEFIYVFQKESQ